jgi:hypothetical protein
MSDINRRTGLSADYVYREMKRSVDDSHCSPPVISECTKAAFRGGAKGLVSSLKYSEMKLANLAVVGDALREMEIIS